MLRVRPWAVTPRTSLIVLDLDRATLKELMQKRLIARVRQIKIIRYVQHLSSLDSYQVNSDRRARILKIMMQMAAQTAATLTVPMIRSSVTGALLLAAGMKVHLHLSG